MEECRTFETEFRGFRKSDVLTYIDELRSEQQHEREEWENQIAVLSQQVAEEKEKTAALSQQLEEAKAAADENVRIAEMEERCDALEQEKTALTLQTEELQQAVAALWKEKSELAAAATHATERLERLQTLSRAVCKELAVEAEPEEAATESPKKAMEQWLF